MNSELLNGLGFPGSIICLQLFTSQKRSSRFLSAAVFITSEAEGLLLLCGKWVCSMWTSNQPSPGESWGQSSNLCPHPAALKKTCCSRCSDAVARGGLAVAVCCCCFVHLQPLTSTSKQTQRTPLCTRYRAIQKGPLCFTAAALTALWLSAAVFWQM